MLVTEAHVLRAPYKELEDEEDEIYKGVKNCTLFSSGEHWGLCRKGYGKLITRGLASPWRAKDYFVHQITGTRTVKVSASYPIRMYHYQFKSREEVEISGKKQQKNSNIEVSQYAGEFWNCCFDDKILFFAPEIKKKDQKTYGRQITVNTKKCTNGFMKISPPQLLLAFAGV